MCAFAEDLLEEVDVMDMAGDRDNSDEGGKTAGLVVDVGLTTMPYFHDKSAAIAADAFYTAGSGDRGDVKRIKIDRRIPLPQRKDQVLRKAMVRQNTSSSPASTA